MIIVNGSIEVRVGVPQSGGYDPQTRYPVRPSPESWGPAIECQYSVARCDKQARADGGPFSDVSYSVLIEGEQPFTGERLRLRDREGALLGEFSVRAAERLDAVGQIRLTL